MKSLVSKKWLSLCLFVTSTSSVFADGARSFLPEFEGSSEVAKDGHIIKFLGDKLGQASLVIMFSIGLASLFGAIKTFQFGISKAKMPEGNLSDAIPWVVLAILELCVCFASLYLAYELYTSFDEAMKSWK
mgnify:CR=1 FL=1|tara:strand:+ start:538 stop:930 length:393 start_codon:yes stop_codon:yes gene_type:complete